MKKEGKKIDYDQAKALSIIDKNGLKVSTLLSWEKEGKMPAKYFEERNPSFEIEGVPLYQMRVSAGLSQTALVKAFNERFDMGLTQVSLCNWELGVQSPRQGYKNLLKQFFEELKK